MGGSFENWRVMLNSTQKSKFKLKLKLELSLAKIVPPPLCVKMFPPHLCVKNVCPRGTNRSMTDKQTDTHSALYIRICEKYL